jgi:hypothetical protein
MSDIGVTTHLNCPGLFWCAFCHAVLGVYGLSFWHFTTEETTMFSAKVRSAATVLITVSMGLLLSAGQAHAQCRNGQQRGSSNLLTQRALANQLAQQGLLNTTLQQQNPTLAALQQRAALRAAAQQQQQQQNLLLAAQQQQNALLLGNVQQVQQNALLAAALQQNAILAAALQRQQILNGQR